MDDGKISGNPVGGASPQTGAASVDPPLPAMQAVKPQRRPRGPTARVVNGVPVFGLRARGALEPHQTAKHSLSPQG